MCQGKVLCHALRIYIYFIESPPAFKIISPFQFFYILNTNTTKGLQNPSFFKK